MWKFFRRGKETGCGLLLRNFADPEDSVMKIASSQVAHCSENDRVIDVLSAFLGGVRRMPVLGEDGSVKGVVSGTDILDFVGGGEKNRLFTNTGLSAKVSKIMSPCEQHLSGTDSLAVALEIFKANGRPFHPVVSENRLSAVLSESDIAHLVSKPTGVSVSAIMSSKPIIISDSASVYEAAKMLCRGPYRRLPAVSNDVVTGIVTPFDILSHLNRNDALNILKLESSPVKAVMSKKVASVRPEADVYEAVKAMKVGKVSGLPVIDEDLDLLGIVTKRDVIQAMG